MSVYLSPGHFLIGEPLTQLPAVDLTNVKMNRLSRWQTYQQRVQQFWQRWSADYLQSLQQRRRWPKASPNLQPGYLVLVKEDNTTPLQWQRDVIQENHPGKDGIVRVFTIKTPRDYLNAIHPTLEPYRVSKIRKATFFPAGIMFTLGTNFGHTLIIS